MHKKDHQNTKNHPNNIKNHRKPPKTIGNYQISLKTIKNNLKLPKAIKNHKKTTKIHKLLNQPENHHQDKISVNIHTSSRHNVHQDKMSVDIQPSSWGNVHKTILKKSDKICQINVSFQVPVQRMEIRQSGSNWVPVSNNFKLDVKFFQSVAWIIFSFIKSRDLCWFVEIAFNYICITWLALRFMRDPNRFDNYVLTLLWWLL